MRATYHLVPVELWAAADPKLPYAAASLAAEGFIHCTDGMTEMVATANRHYRDDRRAFLVLTVDLDAGSRTSAGSTRTSSAGSIGPRSPGSLLRRVHLTANSSRSSRRSRRHLTEAAARRCPCRSHPRNRSCAALSRPATGSRPNTARDRPGSCISGCRGAPSWHWRRPIRPFRIPGRSHPNRS
jgi:hypothetical protein